MAPPAARVPRTVLLDRMGIMEQCADGNTIVATACTSVGREVEFWFEEVTVGKRIVLLQLHTSNLEAPHPYGGCTIRYIPEVVCTHKGLVVLRLSSPHKNFPTDYFVYGCFDGSQQSPRVSRLPMIEPGIYSPNSVGMLRTDGDDYAVAHLRLQVNPLTWQVQAFLDCYSSWNKEWDLCQVALPFPEDKKEEYLCGWQTDMVIPFKDNLLWVDLLQGILLCPNLLDLESIKLEYVPLPSELLSARPAGSQRGRPQEFRNICCTNGELKLVNLHSNNNHSSVEVAIWTLQADMESWKKETGSLNHPRLLSNICSSLPPLFPVLSTDKRDILYLTVVRENKARLIQVKIKSWTLRYVSSYRHFFNHRNPPYPSELSKYLHSRPGDWQQRRWRLRPRRVQPRQFPSCASSSQPLEVMLRTVLNVNNLQFHLSKQFMSIKYHRTHSYAGSRRR